MEVQVTYLGQKKFEVVARNHQIVSDQPVESGGANDGMSPPELFLAGLGSCAAYYAIQYLETRALPTDGLNVHVSGVTADHPSRIASIRVTVLVPGSDDHDHVGLSRAMRACLIHRTLEKPPAVDFQFLSTGPKLTADEFSHAWSAPCN
jgi:putative redox protein